MSYDAIALLEKEHHLRVPVIGRQRPTMGEHDGLTFAPVLVNDLDAASGRNRAHVVSSLGSQLLLRCVLDCDGEVAKVGVAWQSTLNISIWKLNHAPVTAVLKVTAP